MHFSETCDEDTPQLITHVETTRAGINDEKALDSIHAGLENSQLLPDHHLVDAGYVDAANLLQSQNLYGVDLLGLVRHNYWWQADTNYDVTHFSIDWQAQAVICPHGQTSPSWTPAQDGKDHPVIKVKFSQSDCKACPGQTSCTGQIRRTLTLQPQERMQALPIFDGTDRIIDGNAYRRASAFLTAARKRTSGFLFTIDTLYDAAA